MKLPTAAAASPTAGPAAHDAAAPVPPRPAARPVRRAGGCSASAAPSSPP